jgi:drug/metabolite transporter (DMT)-like permease
MLVALTAEVKRVRRGSGRRSPVGYIREVTPREQIRARPAGHARASLLMLVGASVGWGLSTTLSSYALRQFQPGDLLVVELLVGGAVIWTLALRAGRASLITRHWKLFALLGLIEPGMTYFLGNLGLSHDSAATTSLLFATEAVLVAIFAALLLGERVDRRILAALTAGVGGALVIGLGEPARGDSMLGHLFVLGATASAAAYALTARRIAHLGSPLTVTTFQLLAAATIALPATAIGDLATATPSHNPDAIHWLAAILGGLAGVAVPFALYNRAIVNVEATIAAGVLNIVPLVGLTSAVVLLGNTPTGSDLLGGALILAGAAYIGMREAGTPVDRAPQAVAAFPPAVDQAGLPLLLPEQVGSRRDGAGRWQDHKGDR